MYPEARSAKEWLKAAWLINKDYVDGFAVQMLLSELGPRATADAAVPDRVELARVLPPIGAAGSCVA